MSLRLALPVAMDSSSLPPELAVQLPHGQLRSAANASVKLIFSSWSGMARLKAGRIGALAEDYVEGKMQLEGAMGYVMQAATRLLTRNPLDSDAGWWSGLVQRAKSTAAHSRTRDAA